MAHRRERGPREAVTAALGERGRRTGVVMPRLGEVPLTQDGFEDIDAFFRSPAASSSKGKNRLQPSPTAGPSAAYSQSQPQHLLSSASKRHQRRPDVTHELGVKGRKTGRTIVPTGRIARRSDGMEDIDAFFVDSPATVPPVQRTKRISQILEEQEEDDEEEPYDQTVNYNRSARVSNATSRGRPPEEEDYQEDSEESEQDLRSEEEGDQEEYDEDERQSRGDMTGVSSVHRGRRQSGRSDVLSLEASVVAENQYEEYEQEDDGGTRTMSLEGSSFFNKSNRTIDTNPAPTTARSRLSTRSEIYDDVPSSPSRFQNSSPSSSPRATRNAIASTSRQQRPQDTTQIASSSGDESEQIQNSLTRSAQARRRRSSAVNGQNSTSPIRDDKGKGRPALFRAPSSEQYEGVQANVTDGQDGYDEADDGDDDEQGGFEPAMPVNDADYDDVQQPYDDYPEPGNEYESDEGNQQLDAERDNEASRRTSRYGEDDVEEEAEDGGRRQYSDDDDDNDDDDQQDQDVDREEEYDDEEISEELPPPLSDKGQRRDRLAANDSGHLEDEDDVEERAAPKRKGKSASRQQSQQPVQRRKYQKRVVEYPEGVRRSRRDRTSPVAFWRNEHVIYQRRDSPSGVVYYEKVGVADRPEPPHKSLVNRHKRSRSASAGPNKRAKTRSVSVATDGNDTEGEAQGQGPDQNWAKWDEETDPDGIVWDYVDGKEMQRRVAFTSTMLDPKATKHGYRFQRVFTDGEFMGAGLLIIPPGEKKPLKPAKDNTYVLFCHQGAVRVLVHRTEFSIAKGGFFLIPRGNSYQINNLTDIDAVLIFMQAKEVEAIMEAADDE